MNETSDIAHLYVFHAFACSAGPCYALSSPKETYFSAKVAVSQLSHNKASTPPTAKTPTYPPERLFAPPVKAAVIELVVVAAAAPPPTLLVVVAYNTAEVPDTRHTEKDE